MVSFDRFRSLKYHSFVEHHQSIKQQGFVFSVRFYGDRFVTLNIDLHVVIRAGILE